jgi:Putative inner membrane protein (DUF1819)
LVERLSQIGTPVFGHRIPYNRHVPPSRTRPDQLYTSRIIKGGALLADTTTLLATWDLARSSNENLERLQRANMLAKASRMRSADVLTVLRRRYIEHQDIFPGLVTLVQGRVSLRELVPILYFQTAFSDRLVFDFVVEFIGPRAFGPGREISVSEARAWLLERSAHGETAAPWSVSTANRIVQGLLSALRDFGILEGARTKRIVLPRLAPLPFAFVAYVLRSRTGAPSKRRSGRSSTSS